ncbi:hypothetical protein FQZ97_699140 [compost metagenome]
MLGDIDRRAAVLAAQGQALEHTQADQDDRRRHTDGGVSGQQADGEGGQAHQQDGDQEGVLAADHVAEAAEHQRPERANQEAGGECHQGEDEGRGVVDPGEELLADDGGQGAVEKEVVPLEDRAQGGREDHLALVPRRGRGQFLGNGRCVLGHCSSPAPREGSYCCPALPLSASTTTAQAPRDAGCHGPIRSRCVPLPGSPWRRPPGSPGIRAGARQASAAPPSRRSPTPASRYYRRSGWA